MAMSTAPGLPRDGFQHPTVVDESVLAILGSSHHVAARSGSPPNMAETICHGGTGRSDGLESNTTPLDSVAVVAVLLVETFPRVLTSAWMSGGPPLFTSSGLAGSVTILALARAFRTATTSALVSASAKKCWLTRTSFFCTHPSVFPSVLRGLCELPEAGQDGVETCITKPLPSAFQASRPLEWPCGSASVFTGSPSNWSFHSR